METEAYLRSVRPVLMGAFDRDYHHGAEPIVDRITDNLRDLFGLDALLELVQGNAEVASLIMVDVRDMIQLDYIEGVRGADTLEQILQLMEDDPWGNDERVVIVGFYQIVELINQNPRSKVEQMSLATLNNVCAILSSRMAAHRPNVLVQRIGVRVFFEFGFGVSEEVERFRPKLIAMAPDACHSLVAAMLLREQDEIIQKCALAFFGLLLGSLARVENAAENAAAVEIATQLVRAPEGNGRGINAVFRAMENFPNNQKIVLAGFFTLSFLDRFARPQLVEYTNAHEDWREILENTDPACRPGFSILGIAFDGL